MEHIDLKDRSWPEWFAIVALTKSGKAIPSLPQGGLDVCLTINGVEVSFLAAVGRIEEDLDHYINKEAKKLMHEKIELLQDLMGECFRSLKEKAVEQDLIKEEDI